MDQQRTPASDVRSLAIDPVNPNTVYVGTGTDGVFKTTDVGGTWIAASDGLTTGFPISALVIDPTNPTIVYAAAQGVFKSASGGATWSAVISGLTPNVSVFALAMDPTAPSTVYAGTSAGLFKTINGGSSWGSLGVGSTVAEVHAVAIDPTNPSIVYAGTRALFKSTNAGASWSDASAGLQGGTVQALAIDPSTPSTLYAGTVGFGMFRSTDGAGSWGAITIDSSIVDGVPVHSFVGAFASEPLVPGSLYVGTGVNGFGGGVFNSTDGGTTWSPYGTGLPNAAIHALVIDPRTRPLYAATGNAGPEGVFAIQAPLTACPPTPQSACQSASSRRASVAFRSSAGARLDWKWTSSAATSKADFGNPMTTSDLLLCVYDGTGIVREPTLRASAVIPAGGTCAGRQCWKESNTGFTYMNRDLTQNGIARLTVWTGKGAEARISVKGMGAGLDMPGLPMSGPVTVQLLRSDSPLCWEADYATPIKNDATQFRANSMISTYERIQQQVFDVSCSSDSCHSSVGRAADLILDPGFSWKLLVGHKPSNLVAGAQGYLRVSPGRPDDSFILAKLTSALAAGEGVSMPYNAAPLTQETVDVIRAWILAGAPTDGVVAGDDGRALGAGDDPSEVSLPPPLRGVQIRTTSPPLAPGTEETGCHYLKLPSDVDIDVNRFQVAVTGGSHHQHIYRALDKTLNLPDHYEVCNQAVNFDQWELVVPVQLRRVDWELPPGVAYHFRAGEQLLMQTHFVNVGSLETVGEGKSIWNLQAAEPGTITQYAGTMFGQDKDVFVPKHANTTLAAECVFPKALNLMSQSGHYHFRGREFKTYRWDDGVRGEQIYDYQGYNDPPFTVHNPPLSFAQGQGLQWECYWENNTDNDFKFGPFTATNEHCNWFGLYYPADSIDEFITCVKKDGIATTTVRNSK